MNVTINKKDSFIIEVRSENSPSNMFIDRYLIELNRRDITIHSRDLAISPIHLPKVLLKAILENVDLD